MEHISLWRPKPEDDEHSDEFSMENLGSYISNLHEKLDLIVERNNRLAESHDSLITHLSTLGKKHREEELSDEEFSRLAEKINDELDKIETIAESFHREWQYLDPIFMSLKNSLDRKKRSKDMNLNKLITDSQDIHLN